MGARAIWLSAVVALLLVLAVFLALAPPAHGAFPGANGRIAWDPGGNVGTINPDGTDARFYRLDFHSLFSTPGWSADGTKLAFVQDIEVGEGFYQVFVANADFSSPHEIGGFGETHSPAWSPDGTKIAVAGYGIGVLSSDGGFYSFPQELTSNRDDGQPQWSPDGTKIVFVRQVGFLQTSIFVMNADGTAQTNLSNGLGDGSPNWSPDGSKIAFSRTDTSSGFPYPPSDVWVMNSDGTGQVNITNDATLSDHSPAWSPDGKEIAYITRTTTSPPSSSLKIMKADGSDSRTVITGGPYSNDGDPDWEPLPGPQRSDFKNAAQFCKAKRAFMGESAFGQSYGRTGRTPRQVRERRRSLTAVDV